jgi:ABC-type branched-subunit amino acid transport system permease subunit
VGKKGALILAVAFAGMALLPLFIHNDYWGTVLDTGGTYALVAVGLNLLCGGTGQFSLGHAGFFAVGAFTAAIMTVHGLPFWADIVAGGLVAGAVGLVVGIPVLRVTGPYFAIATLAFGLLASDVFGTAGWSEGRTGFTLNPPQIGGYTFTASSFFWVVLLLLAAGTLVAARLRNGATGKAWVALRESSAAAQASGINVGRHRVLAFAISAVYAGVGGALLAHWALYVAAASFGIALSILFVAMIVVGGLDSIIGSLVGAIFLTTVQQFLINSGQGLYSEPIYGAIIVMVLLFLPGGLVRIPGIGRTGVSPSGRAAFGRAVRG